MRKVGEPFECPVAIAEEFLRNEVARVVRPWQMPSQSIPQPTLNSLKSEVPSSSKKEGISTILCNPNPDAKVGIAIPALNPGEYLARCLRSIMTSGVADICDVVLVDNGSKPRCDEAAANLMRAFNLRGRIMRTPENLSCGGGINLAAQNVAGDYLLILNVDTELLPDFLEPMVAILDEDDSVAVVGNKHSLPGGAIDSAGSEWSWEGHSYQHRGRDRPADLSQPAELDMVTFACALVRRSVWDEIGGFNVKEYPGAYWEDSEFCMRVRKLGYRIVYEPDSEIIHYGRHTGGTGRWRSFYEHNSKVFHRKWIDTGFVEGFARRRGSRCDPMRIVVGMIALNEEEFVEAAIASAYEADKIVVVLGGTQIARETDACGPKGEPIDSTLERVRDFYDPDDKITVVGPHLWEDKRAMRNAYLEHCERGDMVVVLDADEVLFPDALWRLFAEQKKRMVLTTPCSTVFWNDLWTLGAGLAWERFSEQRVFRYSPGVSYKNHHGIAEPLPRRGPPLDWAPWAHYAWVRPVANLRRKCEFYVKRDGLTQANYMEDIFLRWREEPEAVESGPGTHLFGGGKTCRFARRHPPQVEKLILEGKIGGEEW